MKRLSTMTVLVAASLAAVTAMATDPPSGMNMSGMQMSGAANAQKEKVGHTTGSGSRLN
jgi:hypothetical protein